MYEKRKWGTILSSGAAEGQQGSEDQWEMATLVQRPPLKDVSTRVQSDQVHVQGHPAVTV